MATRQRPYSLRRRVRRCSPPPRGQAHFPSSRKGGNGAHPISDLPEIGLVYCASRVNPTCDGARGLGESPLEPPLRSGSLRALRGRAHPCDRVLRPPALHPSSVRASRAGLTAAARIVGAPALPIQRAPLEMTRDAEQGATMIRPPKRAGISFRWKFFGCGAAGAGSESPIRKKPHRISGASPAMPGLPGQGRLLALHDSAVAGPAVGELGPPIAIGRLEIGARGVYAGQVSAFQMRAGEGRAREDRAGQIRAG
jgi:hypothetical protein